ncbi:MAG: glycoside hydrolase family 3 C-terminal domain-containing protein, partial [Muribaculaceae bacterium]|nr:glycoside hydrolase family 3 C-terminal domain-containing protein [Muribaculaceae bacterium]
LWESYLPAFKTLVQQGKVRQVMCAYQRFEGQACCGSDRLLQQILRDRWGFDGMVVSDCGAINDFYQPKRHGVSADAQAASALGVISGTDVECGRIYQTLPDAVKRGDLTEADIDRSVRRLLTERFRLGDFDPDEEVEWSRIPQSVVASAAHRALARRMAEKQTVLLKNNGILPLERGTRVMLIGPNAADSTMQWGIYYGQPSHTVTLLEGLAEKLGSIPYTQGCGITTSTEQVSIFDRITDAEGNPGMSAQYWNNLRMEGEPAARVNYTSPIKLDNGGNTVFAPGVELENFTVRMKGYFTAEADETLQMIYNNDDGFRIIIDGDTVHNRWKSDPLNFRNRPFPVRKGQRYEVEINYMQLADDATLNFDICRQAEVSAEEIVRRAADADVVIFAGGISPALEREQAKVTEPGFDNGDRTSIELPAVQRSLIRALHKAGKRVVLVNFSGSAVALTPEHGICDAILQAWYPGEEGGHALADILYGDVTPQGKLPVTFYMDDAQLPPFDSYLMEGRTYRYLRGEPLYPFGHGLSYTTFSYSRPTFSDGALKVKVKNTGKRRGTEVVQVYLRRPADTAGPVKTLRGYALVELEPGKSSMVTVPMPLESFEVWDEATGQMRPLPGEYELMVGGSSASDALRTVKVTLRPDDMAGL